MVLFNDELNFRTIEERTARVIKNQSVSSIHEYDTPGLYAENIQLLIGKVRKVYYLPTKK